MVHASFLSQDEVDSLLASMSGEAVTQAVDTQSASGVRSCDLGSPDNAVLQRMRTLELINERFARGLRGKLLGFTRRNADISVVGIKLQKYGEFERNLPVPANLNMVAIKPLRGTSLFTFDPKLVFLIIDNLFGGNGRYATRVEGREFTTTEQRIIGRLMALTIDAYAAAWQDIYAVTLEYLRSEMHTKFASITRSNEAVVVTTFSIEMGTSGGRLNVCLPYSMIEPIRDVLSSPLPDGTAGAADPRWTRQLSHEMRRADVELYAEFARLPASVGQLMQWRKGDVIALEIPDTVQAFVGNTPVLRGQYGTFNGRHALKVQELLQRDDPFFSKSEHHE